MKHPNGLTSILLHNKNDLCASIVVFIRVGSIDETPSQSGLSHFLEHLIFKGSKNYPGDLMSRNVENMGGEINAATSKEFTMYYISIQKDSVEESIKMLADAIANPLFPPDEVDVERKVVIEEIQRHLDTPTSILYENFYETIYTKSALKNSVIGQVDIIANISYKEILDYYKAYYVPSKMTIVVSGDFNKIKVETVIEETFGRLNIQSVPKDPSCLEEVCAGKDIIERKKIEVGHMISGFLGPSINGDEMYIADLTANILGDGKTSRLYKTLYYDKRLVYGIDCYFTAHKGTGNISVISIFDAKNSESIKAEIQKQIESIISDGITQEELDRAKLAKKTSWSFSLETTLDIAETYGYWHLIGKQKFVDEYLEKIEAIKVDDIKFFLKKFYSSKTFFNVALLPE